MPTGPAACHQRALDLYREIGDRWGQAVTLGHTGDAQHAAGRARQARAAWEEALAILDDLRHPDAGQVRARLAGLAADPGPDLRAAPASRAARAFFLSFRAAITLAPG